MKLSWLDKIGDWNPQLLRELKGRLKPRNVLISIGISLMGQFLLFQYLQIQVPVAPPQGQYDYPVYHHLCTGKLQDSYSKSYLCLRDAWGHFAINWQQWWLDSFVWLSFIGIFTLLVVGTYMLINDLAQEERRGSLNFIRLSPESTLNLLVGKQLGVPILVYLLVALAVPFHLFAGLNAQIPLGQILSFDSVVIASCIFFYSAALLYGLVSGWLAGFQAWLGSGIVLAFLSLTVSLTHSEITNPIAWLRFFSPFDLIPNLFDSSFYRHNQGLDIEKLQWFHLPLGASSFFLFSFALLNYALWTYWVWKGLQRCFRNPNTTILSKRQSYLFTACFTVSTLGFALPGYTASYQSAKEWLFQHLLALSFFDLMLFLYLIAALLPHRQALQDWARYRREKVSTRKHFWQSSLVQDLIYAEKSPALVAIAINLVIAIAPLALLVVFSSSEVEVKTSAFFSLGLAASLVMFYAAIAQLMLFMKTQNRILWALGTVGAAIILPPIILGVLSIQPGTTVGFLWLLSVGAPIVTLYSPAVPVAAMTVFFGLLGQWCGFALLSLQLRRQLRIAGESATKALLAGRPPLPSSGL
jgi:hypothetical protein